MSTKRKTADDGESAASKKARKDENLKLFDRMKKEADENRKKASDKKQTEVKAKSSRRTTITAASSSRAQKVVEKPSRKSIAAVNKPNTADKKPTSSRRRVAPPTPPAAESSEEEEEENASSEEDEFDRLVQKNSSRRHSGRPLATQSGNAYAKVYGKPTTRPPTKRQTSHQRRQTDNVKKTVRGYHSSDDSVSEDESEGEFEEEEEEEDIQEKPKKSVTPVKPKECAPAVTTAPAVIEGAKDDMMVQMDNILFSIVCFILGALLVFGLYFTVTSLDMTCIFTSLFGSTFTGLSDHLQGMATRVSILVVALTMTFGATEIFLWFNKRANSRKQAVAEMAKEAKSIMKIKSFYPSEFMMEDVLEECKLQINGVKINRSAMKELWPEVEAVLLEDARLQAADHIFEGKRRRCFRYAGSQKSPAASPSVPLAVAAKPTGQQFNML